MITEEMATIARHAKDIGMAAAYGVAVAHPDTKHIKWRLDGVTLYAVLVPLGPSVVLKRIKAGNPADGRDPDEWLAYVDCGARMTSVRAPSPITAYRELLARLVILNEARVAMSAQGEDGE